jgi:transposase-like protein
MTIPLSADRMFKAVQEVASSEKRVVEVCYEYNFSPSSFYKYQRKFRGQNDDPSLGQQSKTEVGKKLKAEKKNLERRRQLLFIKSAKPNRRTSIKIDKVNLMNIYFLPQHSKD